jgi:hypothetical protein
MTKKKQLYLVVEEVTVDRDKMTLASSGETIARE